MIHEAIGTCFSGTTYLVTKYMPPAVGYAETSSATALNEHCGTKLERQITNLREQCS